MLIISHSLKYTSHPSIQNIHLSIYLSIQNTLSCVQLFVTLWSVACQAPLSIGFPRQEYWSKVPFPTLGNLPDLGIEPSSLACPVLQEDYLLDHIWLQFQKKIMLMKNLLSSILVKILCSHLWEIPNEENSSNFVQHNRNKYHSHKILRNAKLFLLKKIACAQERRRKSVSTLVEFQGKNFKHSVRKGTTGCLISLYCKNRNVHKAFICIFQGTGNWVVLLGGRFIVPLFFIGNYVHPYNIATEGELTIYSCG